MLVVYSANGEMYKLRAADAKERQLWVTQLRACAKYHMETNSKIWKVDSLVGVTHKLSGKFTILL
ncbi:Oxysterol-binding protein-related protein 10 [Myotis davidii]|uniref:Oxysterol-binding protein-related protein 10 n=1 Tax=Myotis davidii TaxID=225400 RepID=L5M4W4_MYODS|nr:Oxysterol-binding protein-related protein 10 [Myotis davidii]